LPAHAADRFPGADAFHPLLQPPAWSRLKAAAAIGLGPGRNAPALVADALLPLGRVAAEFLATFQVHHPALALQRGRKIRLEPFASFSAEGVQVGASKICHRV